MSYGITAYNNLGEVVIHSDLPNLYISKSGQLSSGTQAVAYDSSYGDPVLFVQIPVNEYAGNVYVDTAGSQVWVTASTAMNYFLAQPKLPPLTDSYGIKVLSAAGEVIFHSGARPVDIFDVAYGTLDVSTGDAVLTHASLPNAYYSVNDVRGRRADGIGLPYLLKSLFKDSDSQLTHSWAVAGTAPGPMLEWGYYANVLVAKPI